MTDTVTITAEQAAALPGPFVVDGMKAPKGIWDSSFGPPAVFADADKECPTCDGSGCAPVKNHPRSGCETCHGTGRTVVELVTRCQRCEGKGTLDLTSEELSLALEGNADVWTGDDSPGYDDCDICDGTGSAPLGLFTVSLSDNDDGTYTVTTKRVEP